MSREICRLEEGHNLFPLEYQLPVGKLGLPLILKIDKLKIKIKTDKEILKQNQRKRKQNKRKCSKIYKKETTNRNVRKIIEII